LGRLARLQQRDGAGALATQAVQQGVVVLGGDLQGFGNLFACAALRQQPGEKRARFLVVKRIWPDRERL